MHSTMFWRFIRSSPRNRGLSSGIGSSTIPSNRGRHLCRLHFLIGQQILRVRHLVGARYRINAVFRHNVGIALGPFFLGLFQFCLADHGIHAAAKMSGHPPHFADPLSRCA